MMLVSTQGTAASRLFRLTRTVLSPGIGAGEQFTQNCKHRLVKRLGTL